ncbi:MAG: spore maturation protein [Archangium gephyra]|uniref:Spore maturation protein n=1 Tax=Archangium gephyra TaxID=48 RepID=A0A2W5UE27_9BACT|nr:MAG: spore maturation protein [Archangium gephyra]
MNWIFLALIVVSVLTGLFTGTMPKVTEATIKSSTTAVELAISLIGQMTLWLGLFGVVREAGLLRSVANGLKPVMARLFPEVPPEHPAMGAMIMNLAANVLGLGNAATPFGLKAMAELDKLNPRKGVATNSMALFLAINTSGVAVLPLGVVAVRAATGSKDPAGIIAPTLIATACSTICAIIAAKVLERRRFFAAEKYGTVDVDFAQRKEADAAQLARAEELAQLAPQTPLWRKLMSFGVLLAVIAALGFHVINFVGSGFDVTRDVLSNWLLPVLMLAIVTVGFGREVRVYEAFITAAKEGFQTCVAIIPFLVGMLVAIGMFRASGAMEVMVKALTPLVSPIGFPPEALPMALIRPLSGSGALAVMSDALKTYGPDSFLGYLFSVLNGGTETTFYVLAVYFGAVQVKSLRHALAACVVADFAGPLGAFFACKLFFSSAPLMS